MKYLTNSHPGIILAHHQNAGNILVPDNDRISSTHFTKPPGIITRICKKREYNMFVICFQVKSRKYQGVFEVKSRAKTWQVPGIWSQQLEH